MAAPLKLPPSVTALAIAMVPLSASAPLAALTKMPPLN
ncbi:hypothetical protein J2X67_005327 [Variovorax sp. 3319]|nr:hypothetical protein [Variovorax sp. 3319]